MEKIWKEVKKVSFSTCDELLIEFKKNNFKISPWIEDIVKKNNYQFNNNRFPVRFATPLNSMVDSDGVPHLPKLGRALGLYFIETYWSYPKAIFHPHNDFVMMVK